MIWNRSKKRDAWGRKHQRPRQADQWIEQQDERLRIVGGERWEAAHASLQARRGAYLAQTAGVMHGRPAAGKPSKYMLSGLLECGRCHGSLVVRTNRHGTGKTRTTVRKVACWHYVSRGPAGCTNNTEAPLEDVDAMVFDAVRRLLSPAVVDMAIAFAVEMLKDAGVDHRGDVERARDTLDVEAERLTALTAAGLGDLPAVIARLRAI